MNLVHTNKKHLDKNYNPPFRNSLCASGGLTQGCQTRGLLGAALHVGNRAESRMMFFDLEITTSPGNGLCNVARSEVDLQKQKKKVITSPATPNHRSSSDIVNQKLSFVAPSEIH